MRSSTIPVVPSVLICSQTLFIVFNRVVRVKGRVRPGFFGDPFPVPVEPLTPDPVVVSPHQVLFNERVLRVARDDSQGRPHSVTPVLGAPPVYPVGSTSVAGRLELRPVWWTSLKTKLNYHISFYSIRLEMLKQLNSLTTIDKISRWLSGAEDKETALQEVPGAISGFDTNFYFYFFAVKREVLLLRCFMQHVLITHKKTNTVLSHFYKKLSVKTLFNQNCL